MGECILLIEEEERPLRSWDYVHCPPGTGHVFVGAGDGPCVIVGAGNRADDDVFWRVYRRSEPALRHGASVESDTTSGAEANAPFRPHWRHERPEGWNALPWAE